MRSDPTEVALRNLERLVTRDPILRNILHQHLPEGGHSSHLVPPVDVIETPDAWIVLVELPGVPKDSVRVHLDGTRLTIDGTKPRGLAGRRRKTERETGPFSREFQVPFEVDAPAITAHLEEGILTVTLPRIGASEGRDVPVQ